MNQDQQRMLHAFKQIKEGFSPSAKGKGTIIREKVYDNLLNDFHQDECLLLISIININETSHFVKDLYSLIDDTDGELVQEALIDTIYSILSKIGFHLQEQTRKDGDSILPLLKEYIAFNGNFTF